MTLLSDCYKLGKGNFPGIPKQGSESTWVGIYFNKYSTGKYDPKQPEERIVELMDNDDVTKYSGI